MDKLNAGQRWVVVLMDVMLLVELCIAVYLGQKNPADLTLIFLRTFAPAAALTVVAARIAIRSLAARAPDPSADAVADRGNPLGPTSTA